MSITPQQIGAIQRVTRQHGTKTPDLNLSWDTLDWKGLHNHRKSLLKSMQTILDTASAGDRQMSEDEVSAYDGLEQLLENTDREMDRRQGRTDLNDGRCPGKMQATSGGTSVHLPTSHALREPRLLARGEPLSGTLPGTVNRGAGLPSLGDIVKAQIGLGGSGDIQGAHGVGTPSSGGHTVPEPLAAEVIDLSRNRSRVIEAGALTVPMESSTLKFARVDQDPTGHWRAEHAEIPESEMAFSAVTLEAKALAALCRVSIELIEDSANFESTLLNAISEALAQELDRVALLGSGQDDEPQGIFTANGIQSIEMGTDGAELESYSPLSESLQRVWEANVEPGDFVLAPRTRGEIDRLVDSTGQPLNPPRSVDERRLLQTNQVPVDQTQGTSNVASSIFTGQWSSLLVGMRTSLILEASRVSEGAFRKMEVLIRAYVRADIALARPDHFAVIKGINPPDAA